MQFGEKNQGECIIGMNWKVEALIIPSPKME